MDWRGKRNTKSKLIASNTIIPQQSQLWQWTQTLPFPSGRQGPVLTGKIIPTKFHKDNTPCREPLKQSSFTQGCRKPRFKMSLLQLLFQHYHHYCYRETTLANKPMFKFSWDIYLCFIQEGIAGIFKPALRCQVLAALTTLWGNSEAMTHPNSILLKNHLLTASIFIYPKLMTLAGAVSILPATII